jgi:BON domain
MQRRLSESDCPLSTLSLIKPLSYEVQQRLNTSPYLALRLIRCSCDDARIILHGRLPSYYLKQLAQTLARQVTEAHEIDNRLEVA